MNHRALTLVGGSVVTAATGILILLVTGIQVDWYTDAFWCDWYTGGLVYQYTGIQVDWYTNTLVHRWTGILVFFYSTFFSTFLLTLS